jgi:hypothetical protein
MDTFVNLMSRTSPNTGNTVNLGMPTRNYTLARVFTCEKRVPLRIVSTGYPQEAAVYVNGVEIWSGTLTEDFPVAQFDIYDYIAGKTTFKLGVSLDDGYIATFSGLKNVPNTVVNREAEAVAPDALRWDEERSDAWLCLWSTEAVTYQVAETLVTLPAYTAAQAYMRKGWAFVDGAATLLRKTRGGMMVFWQCKDTGLLKGWCFEVVGRGVLGADVKRDAGGLRQETRDCSQYVEVRTTGCSARDAAYLRSLNYSDDINTADDSDGSTLYLLDEVPAVAYGERETVSLRFEIITVS